MRYNSKWDIPKNERQAIFCNLCYWRPRTRRPHFGRAKCILIIVREVIIWLIDIVIIIHSWSNSEKFVFDFDVDVYLMPFLQSPAELFPFQSSNNNSITANNCFHISLQQKGPKHLVDYPCDNRVLSKTEWNKIKSSIKTVHHSIQ